MAKRSIVPFGPQHPVLPEPVHLDLVLEDETVVQAVPSIGYIHRGLEKLVEKRDFKQYCYIAERICGICSCGHGLGYCMAVEEVMGVEVPERANYLRAIWVEMSRIHSHLLWLGLLADAMGFESLFMESWRLREKILDMFDETAGGRIIHSVNQVGGTALGGAMDNGLNPTTTLGCGTWGNNIISENLWYTHLMNVSRISYKVPSMYVPSDEEIWAE